VATQSGLWLPLPRSRFQLERRRRHALLTRLLKAAGHIKSCERTLWRDREHGLWSASQALGCLAECRLWLDDADAEPPAAGRSLNPETLALRLTALSELTVPGAPDSALRGALAELKAAEAAVRAEPFPPRPEHPLDPAGRAALRAGLARKGRFVTALERCLTLVEAAFAERYVGLHPGDGLRLHDGEPARVIDCQGLRLEVFMPARAWPDPREAYRCYLMHTARGVTRLRRPPADAALPPAYFWLCYAHERARTTRRLLAEAPASPPEAIAGALSAAVDAAAKTWLAREPGAIDGPSWRLVAAKSIALLDGHAPPVLARPLVRLGRRAAALRRQAGDAEEGSAAAAPSWQLEAAVLLQALEPLLGRLAETIGGDLPVRAGQQVHVDGRWTGMLLGLEGAVLSVRAGDTGEAHALRLGEVFVVPVTA